MGAVELDMVDDNAGLTAWAESKHPTQDRLEDQIAWYDRKSQTAQHRYKILKISQVIVVGLIPLASIFPIPKPEWVIAILGLAVLITEAVQQLNQDQQNWISYRSTCEELYLYLAGSGPYVNAENGKRIVLIADRIEGLISQEHAKWISAQEQSTTAKGTGKRSTE